MVTLLRVGEETLMVEMCIFKTKRIWALKNYTINTQRHERCLSPFVMHVRAPVGVFVPSSDVKPQKLAKVNRN